MLKNFIRKETVKTYYESQGRHFSKILLVFSCEFCGSEVKHTSNSLKKRRNGIIKCHTCANKGKPFIRAYNRLKKYWDTRDNDIFRLSYSQFIDFTNFKTCHYCHSALEWIPYGPECYKSNLDRKDPKGPYAVENCVPCCWRCNSSKSNKFSYEEWFGMTKYFRDLL